MKKSVLMCLLFLTLASCRIQDADRIQIDEVEDKCVVENDRAAERADFFLKCRREGSWSATCSSEALFIFPPVKKCFDKKVVYRTWLVGQQEWSSWMACSLAIDEKIIRVCNQFKTNR